MVPRYIPDGYMWKVVNLYQNTCTFSTKKCGCISGPANNHREVVSVVCVSGSFDAAEIVSTVHRYP